MRGTYVLAGLCAVFVAGCGGAKLDMNEEFEVPVAGKAFEIDPIKNEQKIKVTGSATDAPVGAFIYLKKNEDAADREIMSNQFKGIVLAKQEKTTEIALEATIPANEEAVVRFTRAAPKTAKAKVRITNR